MLGTQKGSRVEVYAREPTFDTSGRNCTGTTDIFVLLNSISSEKHASKSNPEQFLKANFSLVQTPPGRATGDDSDEQRSSLILHTVITRVKLCSPTSHREKSDAPEIQAHPHVSVPVHLSRNLIVTRRTIGFSSAART